MSKQELKAHVESFETAKAEYSSALAAEWSIKKAAAEALFDAVNVLASDLYAFSDRRSPVIDGVRSAIMHFHANVLKEGEALAAKVLVLAADFEGAKEVQENNFLAEELLED